MKRIFSLLLCLTLLLSVAALFTSCGKSTVNLSEYSVVYTSDSSEYMQNAAKSLATALKKLGGEGDTERVRSTDELEESDKKEILIGKTNRPESQNAFDALDGYSYSITVKGDKIVIVGTTSILTKVALDLFVNTYISCATESVIELESKTVAKDVPMLELDKNTVFVYKNGLDDVPRDVNNQWDISSSQNPDCFDYPVVATHEAAKQLAKKIKVNASSMKLETDKITFSKAVLVGVTKREESVAFNATLNADEYGIRVINNLVLIGANNDTALRSALTLFSELLDDGAVVENDTTRVLLPADFTIVTSAEMAFVTDFPRPEAENLQLTDAMDVGDNSMLYCYTGTGATVSSFTAYCQKLEAAGYCVYMQSEMEESKFVTYVHEQKKQTLHVMYARYKHAFDNGIHTVTKSIRIVSAPLNDNTLLPEKLTSQDLNYERPANVTSNVIAVNHNWIPFDLGAKNRGYGSTYIVTLEDGSFVVVDSGFVNTYDYARFPAILRQLHYEMTGEPASVSNPVRIAAWYLTHDHGDHYQTFYKMLQEFGTSGEFIFEYLIGNFPSDAECYNSDQRALSNKIAHLEKQIETFRYVKVHTGQTFYLANARFEVLCTHEDLYPTRGGGQNDFCTAIKMTLYRTNDEKQLIESSETSVLWLGDQSRKQSDVMVATFGNYMQSDMVQMSHHAGSGATFAVYNLCAPRIVLVPQSRLYYNEHIDDAGGGWIGWSCTRRVVTEIASVEYVIINDDYSTVMTITETGVNMETKSASNPTGIRNIYENKIPKWSSDVMAPETSWIKK